MSHSRSNTSEPGSEASRVFVGGVPPGADQEGLEKMFEKHGKVKGVSVFKGFAFIQYDKREEADAAIKEENGKDFQGNRIEVKYAKRGANKGKDGGGNDDQHSDQGRPPMREPQPYPPAGGRGGRGGQRGRGGGYGRGGYDGGGRGGGYVPAPPRGVYGSFDDSGPGFGGRGGYGGPGGGRGGRFGPDGGPPGGGPPGAPDRRNDCEIVCVSRYQRNYAEVIEGRLKNFGLEVDVLFPNPDIPLPKILGNIASRGVLFAIVVTPLNEEHKSMTVNILQGPTPQEHRNMPYDDAIALLAKTFEQSGGSGPGGPGGAGSGPAERVVGANDEVPNDIRTCIGFLMEQRPLSVMEYDKLIKYFALRREAVLKQEYGDAIPADLAQPPIGPPVDPATKAKQNELNERILAILNKPKPKPAAPSSQVAGPSGAAPGGGLNNSLQMAIDNLIRTGPNLLNQVQASTSGGYSGGGGEQYGHYGYD